MGRAVVLTKRIIPCLDVRDGRVVKGVRFVDLRDAGDPAALARGYEDAGADELVLLDITASVEARATMEDVVRQTADAVFIPLTVGGGIRGVEDIRRMLLAGADKVAVNTAAIERPELIREAADRFGSQCVVVAIDAKATPPGAEPGWRVYTHGGRRPTERDAVGWAVQVAGLGAGEILLTSIDRDGTQDGYDLALTRAVSRAVGIPVVASGGAGTPGHFAEVLSAGAADAALAAGVFHRGTITIGEVKGYLSELGIPVRR